MAEPTNADFKAFSDDSAPASDHAIKATNADFKAFSDDSTSTPARTIKTTNADFKAFSEPTLERQTPKLDTREHNPSQDLKNTIQSGGKMLQGYVSNMGEEATKHPLESADALEGGALVGIDNMMSIPGNLMQGAWKAISPKGYEAAQKLAPALLRMNALSSVLTNDPRLQASIKLAPTMGATGETVGPMAMPLYDTVKLGGAAGKLASRIPIAGAIPRVGNRILAASPLAQRAAKAAIGSAPLAAGLAANEALTNPTQDKNLAARIGTGTMLNMGAAGSIQPVADIAEHVLTKLFGSMAARHLMSEISKSAPIPDRAAPPLAPAPENVSPKERLQQVMSGETTNSAIIPRAVRKAPTKYKNSRVTFENPVDKALWLSTSRNKAGDAALNWLQANTNYTPQEIHEAGQAVRNGVAEMHKKNPAQFELRVEQNRAQSEHQTKTREEAIKKDKAKKDKEDTKLKAEKAKLDAQEQKDREKFKKDYDNALQKFAKEESDLKKAEAKAWEYAENQNRKAHAKATHAKAQLEERQAKLAERRKILAGKVTETVEAPNHISLDKIGWGLRSARLAFINQLPKADLAALTSTQKKWITLLGAAKNKENAAHTRYLAWNQALLDVIGAEPKMRQELKGSVYEILKAKNSKVKYKQNKNSLEITPSESYELIAEEKKEIAEKKSKKLFGSVHQEVIIARNIMAAKRAWEDAKKVFEDMKAEIPKASNGLTKQDILTGVIEEGHQLTWNDINVYHKAGNMIPVEGNTPASKLAYAGYMQDLRDARKDANNLTFPYVEDNQHTATKKAVDILKTEAGKLDDKELKTKWLKVAATFEDPDAIKLLTSRGLTYTVPLGPDPVLMAEVAKSFDWSRLVPSKHTILAAHATLQHLDTYEHRAPALYDYLKSWMGESERASAGVEMPKTPAENTAYYKALKGSADEYELEQGTGDFEALKDNPKLRKYLEWLKNHRAELKDAMTDYLHSPVGFGNPDGSGDVLPPQNQLFGHGQLYPTLMNDIEALSGKFGDSPEQQALIRNMYASYATGNITFHTAHAVGGILGNVSQEPLLFYRLGELKQKRGKELEEFLSKFHKGGQYASLAQEAVEKNLIEQKLDAFNAKVIGDKLDWLKKIVPEDKLQAALSTARGETMEQWKKEMAQATGLIQAADYLSNVKVPDGTGRFKFKYPKMRPDELLDLLNADLAHPSNDPRVLEAYAEIASYMNQTVGYNVPGYNNVGILAHMPWAKAMFTFTGSKQIEAHLTQTFLGNAANALKIGDLPTVRKEVGKWLTFTGLSIALNGSKGLSRETLFILGSLSPPVAKEVNDQLNKFAVVGNVLNWHPIHVQVQDFPMADSVPGGFYSTMVKDQAKLNITHDEAETTDPSVQQARTVALIRIGATVFTTLTGLEEYLHSPIGSQVAISIANNAYNLYQGHRTDMGHSPSMGFGVIGGDREYLMNNMITGLKDFVARTLVGGESNEELQRKSDADADEMGRLREKALAPEQYKKDLKKAQMIDAKIIAALKGAKSPIRPPRLLGGLNDEGEPELTRDHFSWIDSCNEAVPDPIKNAVDSIFR